MNTRTELRKLLGDIALTPLAGGYNNPVFAAIIDGRECVIKVGAPIAEERALALLGGKFSPTLYRSIKTDAISALIMSKAGGANVQSLIDAGKIDSAADICAEMGEKLARDVHSITKNDGGIREAALSNALPLPSYVPREIADIYEPVLRKLDFSPKCLTHGDFGVHNALCPPEGGIVLLDWEWSEFAAPERDIAWFLWFFELHYPDIAGKISERFLAGYGKFGKYNAALLKPWAMYQTAKILRVAEDTDDETSDEWIRRAKWTANVNFAVESARE